MDFEKIERLIKLMKSSGLEELEVEENKSKIHLKLPNLAIRQEKNTSFSPYLQEQNSLSSINTFPSEAQVNLLDSKSNELLQQEKIQIKKKTKEIRSPFVGTFYSAPAPGADNFIEVGQKVSRGDKLCIVEAMKLMNEIEADCDGVVVDILIKNEQPVEYDQVLFLVE